MSLERLILENMGPSEQNAFFSNLDPSQRAALGARPVERSALGRMVESSSFLNSWGLLRKTFELDRQWDIEEPYFVDDGQGGKNFSWYQTQLAFERSREAVYRAVEEMNTFGYVASALDAFAEDATQPDPDTGRSVWIKSKNPEIEETLHDMLDRVGMEDKVFGIARSTAHYGDDFEQTILSRDGGVVSLQYHHPVRLTRVEDVYGKLRGFVGGIIDDEQLTQIASNDEDLAKLRISRPWDFIHFRLLGARREGAHGEPIIFNARRSWRQVKIMEDSLVLYRLNRAPDRLVYYVDVGNQPPDEQYRTVNRWRQANRKRFYLNSQSGVLRQEYNPWSVEEDIFWPRAKGKESSVEKLQGSSNAGDIYDVELFINKLFGDLRIPKAYFGFEGDINSKATLSQQDIRFARSVKRLQRAIVYGVTQLCRIHLALKGKDPMADEHEFTVHMSPISYLDELQRSELTQLRLELVERMMRVGGDVEEMNKPEWFAWVLREYLKLDDSEIERFLPSLAASAAGGDANTGPNPPEQGDGSEKPRDGSPEPQGQGAERVIAAARGSLSTPRMLDAAAEATSHVDANRMALLRQAAAVLRTPKVRIHEDLVQLPPRVENVPSEGKGSHARPLIFDPDAERTALHEDLLRKTRAANVAALLSTCPECRSKEGVQIVESHGVEFMLCGCGFSAEVDRGKARAGSPA